MRTNKKFYLSYSTTFCIGCTRFKVIIGVYVFVGTQFVNSKSSCGHSIDLTAYIHDDVTGHLSNFHIYAIQKWPNSQSYYTFQHMIPVLVKNNWSVEKKSANFMNVQLILSFLADRMSEAKLI